MARPFSALTRQLLRSLSPTHQRRRSRRYWGKIGLAHLITDLGQVLNEAIDRMAVQRRLQRLRAHGWVAGQHNRIELTPQGRVVAQRIALEELALTHPASWDGIWRIVIWDIPESHRRLRNAVRRTLARLGFIRIQQSVWVTPLPCEEEIVALRSELEIEHGLLYIEARKIEGEQLLRQHFKVK